MLKTQGIILRTVKYGESSLILDIYTRDKGLQSFIIGGVRSKKAKTKTGLLQLMSLVDLVSYFRESKDMHRIKEVNPTHIYSAIPFEIAKSSVGVFLIEFIQKTLKEQEANFKLFDFISECFIFLDKSEQSISNFHLVFLLKYASFLGIQPENNFSIEKKYFDMNESRFVTKIPVIHHCLNEEESECWNRMIECDLSETHQLIISKELRKKLLNELIEYFQLHLDTKLVINAHLILEQVLDYKN